MQFHFNTNAFHRRTCYLIRILLAGSCLGAPLCAQTVREGSSRTWDLHACMRYAVEHSPRSRIQQLRNENTAKDYVEAVLGFLPSVSGGVGVNTNFGRSIDPETNTYASVTNFSNSYSLSGSLALFHGFSVVNNLRIAKIAKLQGIENSQLITDDIALTTLQLYADVQYYGGMIRLALDQLTESRSTLRQALVQEELGLKSNADVLQGEARVAADEYNLTLQQNRHDDALIRLKEAMFYPADSLLQLDTLRRWSIAPLTEAPQAESLYRQAVTFLPEVQLAAFNVQSARLSYKSARWQLLPSFSASGGFSTGYIRQLGANGDTPAPFRQQFKERAGESVGITMSIPLFSSFSRQTTLGKQKNEMKIAQQQELQKRREIESAIQQAIQNLEGSAKEYVQCAKQVAAQESAYRAYRRKYEEGIASIIDLQTSATQLLTARAARLNAQLQYFIKQRVVEYYGGTPYLQQEF